MKVAARQKVNPVFSRGTRNLDVLLFSAGGPWMFFYVQCIIDWDANANPSIGLAGRNAMTIRIFQGKEKVIITSDHSLQSFLAFRDAQFRAVAMDSMD